MPILGVIASSAARDFGSMFALQSFEVGANNATTVSFTNIPSTFTHLQLRMFVRANASAVQVNLRFNGDTASNYTEHQIFGGSSASAYGAGNITWIPLGPAPASADTYAAYVCDIVDYANTNKFKTVRSLRGFDNNGAGGGTGLYSGLWRNKASAINRIDMIANTSSFAQFSHFALYGVKSA